MHHTFTRDVQPTTVPSFPQHGSGGHASQGHVQLLPQCGPGKYVSAAEFVGWSLFEQLSGTSDIKQWAEKIATQLSSTARGAAAPRESHISLGGSGSCHSSRTNALLLLQPCRRERATVPRTRRLHLEKHPWHRDRVWRASLLAVKKQVLWSKSSPSRAPPTGHGRQGGSDVAATYDTSRLANANCQTARAKAQPPRRR